jgi:hypothetical protein
MTDVGKRIQAEILEDVKKKAKSVIIYVTGDGEQKEIYSLDPDTIGLANLINRNGGTVLHIHPNPFYQGVKTDA